MPYSFNGVTRRIVVETGTSSLDVEDVYSRWKDWLLLNNAGYYPAFRSFGGDPTITGQFAPKFFFLLNGWRFYVDGSIVPTLSVGLNLYVEGGGDPFVKANGATVINKVSDIPGVDSVTSGGLSPEDIATIVSQVWQYTGPP